MRFFFHTMQGYFMFLPQKGIKSKNMSTKEAENFVSILNDSECSIIFVIKL